MCRFRTLYAREIDCRVSQISEKGLTLLLYKDARCDMNILDETVGSLNWQRHHSRDNANCTVSIWDNEKQQWISKEDTGTESNTEAEKGLASDSFKRACFNWGIGRELYSAPFIWIPAEKADIKTGKNGKPACYDRFEVESIDYDANREICSLTIINAKTRQPVYTFGRKKPAARPVLKQEGMEKESPPPPDDPPLQPQESADGFFYCDDCKKLIKSWKRPDGGQLYPKEIAAMGLRKYGKQLCMACARKLRDAEPQAGGLQPLIPTNPA